MQCAQNVRNPARARRAGAMRWIFYTAELGEILFSSIRSMRLPTIVAGRSPVQQEVYYQYSLYSCSTLPLCTAPFQQAGLA
jgi:hypothetical protein